MVQVIVSACIEKDGKYLLVQENKPNYKGLWNFPGGKLKDNEDIFEGTRREIKEETGYEIEIKSILGIQTFIQEKGQLIIFYFNAITVSENIIFNDSPKIEINDCKWFSLEHVVQIPSEEIRGGRSIYKIIELLKNNVEYPLSIVDCNKNIK